MFAVEINPSFADTDSFCKKYDISRHIATNCIVIEAKRADKIWYAACLVLADDMIDVNGKVRRLLDARRASFASKDTALNLTKMEYGGITPVGLPNTWPLLVDKRIIDNHYIVVGGGNRSSKLLLTSDAVMALNLVSIKDIVKH